MNRAIDDVNLDVKQGDFIAILGHNGSGKSTEVPYPLSSICHLFLPLYSLVQTPHLPPQYFQLSDYPDFEIPFQQFVLYPKYYSHPLYLFLLPIQSPLQVLK